MRPPAEDLPTSSAWGRPHGVHRLDDDTSVVTLTAEDDTTATLVLLDYLSRVPGTTFTHLEFVGSYVSDWRK